MPSLDSPNPQPEKTQESTEHNLLDTPALADGSDGGDGGDGGDSGHDLEKESFGDGPREAKENVTLDEIEKYKRDLENSAESRWADAPEVDDRDIPDPPPLPDDWETATLPPNPGSACNDYLYDRNDSSHQRQQGIISIPERIETKDPKEI